MNLVVAMMAIGEEARPARAVFFVPWSAVEAVAQRRSGLPWMGKDGKVEVRSIREGASGDALFTRSRKLPHALVLTEEFLQESTEWTADANSVTYTRYGAGFHAQTLEKKWSSPMLTPGTAKWLRCHVEEESDLWLSALELRHHNPQLLEMLLEEGPYVLGMHSESPVTLPRVLQEMKPEMER